MSDAVVYGESELLTRTVESVIEADLSIMNGKSNMRHFEHSGGKRVFQLVKLVTGQSKNERHDYTVERAPDHYGAQSVVLRGRLGFIRATLTPLFEVV